MKNNTSKSWFAQSLKWLGTTLCAGALVGISLGVTIYSVVYYQLPAIDSLTDYRPKIPLRIYTQDNVLIGEFGEERRDFVPIDEMPRHLRLAILAAEDNGFYEHPGIEISGIARAALSNLLTGRRGQGGSTITMQVARNFFLTTERSYARKIYEIALSFKIERLLSKDKIFEVYANQIYLGNRSYGFGSAAKTYFGKDVRDISISEAATLAGLPVAPSAYNPFVNIRRATMRRNYVLGRMKQLGFIDDITYETAMAQPIEVRQQISSLAKVEQRTTDLHAGYAAELARMLIAPYFGDTLYNQGINVYTTIRSNEQRAASASVRSHLMQYDHRYGYRGVEGYVDLSNPETRDRAINRALAHAVSSANLLPGVVTHLSPESMTVVISNGKEAVIEAKNFKHFARHYLAQNGKKPAAQFQSKALKVGAIVRVSKNPQGKWQLSQIPEVESAFMAADFQTGSIHALVGGFDFQLNQFNHVTQAWRQPGSSFKPFIYSAALDKGFTPATIINDAPISIDPRLTGGKLWEPRNYEGRFDGPMTLATALKKSKNLVSIRVMQAIDPFYAQDYLSRFGFDPKRHPPFLTTALGAGSVTPWEMVAGFSVFANGGYRVYPYLIDKVTDTEGNLLMQARPQVAGVNAARVIDERNAFVMHTLLNGVAREGTGRRAGAALQRYDIGAKTGTTNDAVDAWFVGYAGNLVAAGWVGYDQPKPLGSRETGGGLALPIWVDYMKSALKNVPEFTRDQPVDVVERNGLFFYADQINGEIQALDLQDHVSPSTELAPVQKKTEANDNVRNQIF